MVRVGVRWGLATKFDCICTSFVYTKLTSYNTEYKPKWGNYIMVLGDVYPCSPIYATGSTSYVIAPTFYQICAELKVKSG